MADLRIYKPSNAIGSAKHPLDENRCPVEVVTDEGRWTRWGQCSFRPKYDAIVEGKSVKVCGHHRPEAMAKREAKKQERYEREGQKWARRFEMPKDFRAALESIAAGHNDPRTLAKETLDRWQLPQPNNTGV